ALIRAGFAWGLAQMQTPGASACDGAGGISRRARFAQASGLRPDPPHALQWLRSPGDVMEDQWLTWAKRLQAIASTGLHFCKDDFDRQRYREVATIAHSMLASLGNIPIERVEGLFSDFAKGYATPKVDVRGAVIEDGKVLLVREKSDGRWT